MSNRFMRRRFMNKSGAAFDYSNYMTIEPVDDIIDISIPRADGIMYGIDGFGWEKLEAPFIVTIERGHLISFKKELKKGYVVETFDISGRCNLKGNCLSMIFGDNAMGKKDISLYPSSFNSTFASNHIIYVDSDFLPATTLADDCYKGMFQGCSSLTTAPELPATTLADDCYSGMFSDCTSLTTAPVLPATTLADDCYDMMFYNCSKLNYIKMLATKLSFLQLSYWVSGVASSGTFVKDPSMTTLSTGASGIPEGWTVVNDGEDGGNLFTFTIDSMPDIIQGEYQAEQGMTWSEWCASEYNIDNFYIGSGSNWVLLTIKGTGIAGDSHYQLCNNEGDDILGTDIISAEIYYEIY